MQKGGRYHYEPDRDLFLGILGVATLAYRSIMIVGEDSR